MSDKRCACCGSTEQVEETTLIGYKDQDGLVVPCTTQQVTVLVCERCFMTGRMFEEIRP